MIKNVFTRKKTDVRALGQTSPASFFLATVASVSGPEGLTIIPDGQTEAVPKKYKVLLAGTEPPAVGARVVVMRHSGTCIILGTIGLPQDLDADSRIGTLEDEVGELGTALTGKVSKAGDTMTGDLHMLDAAPYIDSDEITIGTRPESNKWSKRFSFRDSARKTFARVQGYQGSNGNVGIQLIGEQTVNGENKVNYLGLYMSDTGTGVVDLSSAAWRKALGLGNTNGALPLTIAQGGSGDTQTVRETTIANVATAGANVTLTQTLFCRWGKLAMIEIMGKATADIAAGSTVFTLVSGKRPALDSSAQVWRSTTFVSTIHPDGTAVLVGGTLSSGSGFTILACYLLA